MKISRVLAYVILVGIFFSICAGEDSPPVPPKTPLPEAARSASVTEAQRNAMLRIYDRAVLAGLPDATGAAIIVGRIDVITPDVEDPKMPQGIRDGVKQSKRVFRTFPSRTSEGKTITTIEGCHLRFVDGRWLINLSALRRPTNDFQIVPSAEVLECAPASFDATIREGSKTQQIPAGQLTEFADVVTAADGPVLKDILNSVWFMRRLTGMDLRGMVGALHLLKLGSAAAGDFLLYASAVSQVPYARNHSPGLDVDQVIALDDQGGPEWGRATRMDWRPWKKEHAGKLGIQDPAIAVQSWCEAWFAVMLRDDTELAATGLTPAKAVSGAVSLASAQRQDKLRKRLGMLVARRLIPAFPEGKAPFPLLVQAWKPGLEAEDYVGFFLGPDALADQSPEVIRRMQPMSQRPQVFQPVESAIPALLAIADDKRASRWVDDGLPRTLGDNALRALGRIVGCDPRLVIGRKTDVIWTDAERTATVVALRAWWKGLNGKPLSQDLVGSIARMPPASQAKAIASQPIAGIDPLLEVVASAWIAKPPEEVDVAAVATILGFGFNHPGMAKAVRTWTAEGRLKPLLDIWNDRHGNPAPMDAVVAEGIAMQLDTKEKRWRFQNMLNCAFTSPTAERWRALSALAGKPIDDRAFWLSLAAARGESVLDDPYWRIVDEMENGQWDRLKKQGIPWRTSPEFKRVDVLRYEYLALLLNDLRHIPDQATRYYPQGNWLVFMEVYDETFKYELPDNKGPPDPPRGRLSNIRVCDIVATQAHEMLVLSQTGWAQIPDPWASQEVRDDFCRKAYAALCALVKPACIEAKMPNPLADSWQGDLQKASNF